MRSDLNLGSEEPVSLLELFFRDSAEYFGVAGFPYAFAVILERDRQHRRCGDSRPRKPITNEPVPPNWTWELTVATCTID